MEKIKRVCRVCKSSEKEFKKNGGNTRVGICKPCHNSYMKEYNTKRKEIVKQLSK